MIKADVAIGTMRSTIESAKNLLIVTTLATAAGTVGGQDAIGMTDQAAGATGVITAGTGVIVAGIEVIIAGIEGIVASMIVSETAATGEMLDFSGATEGMTTYATVQTEGSMVVRSTSITPLGSAETEASQRFAIRQINSA